MISAENFTLSFGDYVTIVTICTGTIGAVAMFAWGTSQYLAKQFNETRLLIDTKIEKLELNILARLEGHEKNDAIRFERVQDDIWDIRVRNAARDGMTPLTRKHSE
jgi:hypothetical protein